MSLCFLRVKNVFVGVAAICLSSCFSPKFNAEWKKAESSGERGRKWVGRWESQKGVGGRLRAVTKTPASGGLNVYFEAGWHGFTTAYPVELRADAQNGSFRVFGEHHLKSFVGGGLYKYDGSLSSDAFSVRYSSSYDSGTFTLAPAETH